MNFQLVTSDESLTRRTIFFVFSLGLLVNQVFSQANFCGTKDPDPDKTCVSIRLSWQEEPIYFCTEKGNIKYRNQYGNQPMHCENHWNKETLLVATPWDACPLASVPDQCQNVQCPPKPLNRTCEIIPPKSDQPWECCPRYACQGFHGDCHLKQLEPGCMSPPKGKTNCVGFIDPHVGCCTQFQCDGDGKPGMGMCPMHKSAMKYSAMDTAMPTPPMMMSDVPMTPPMTRSGGSPSSGGSVGMPIMPLMPGDSMSNKTKHRRAATMKPKGRPQGSNVNMVGGNGDSGISSEHHRGAGSYNSYSTYGGGYGGEKHSISIAVEPYHNYPAHGPLPFHLGCTGDYNCPGDLKCCSHDMSVYSDGSAISRNTHPTYGYCVEPVM